MLSAVIWGLFLSNGHVFSVSHGAELRSRGKVTVEKVTGLSELEDLNGNFADLGLGTACRIRKPRGEGEDPGAYWQIQPQDSSEGKVIPSGITLKECKEKCLTEEFTNKTRHCYAIEYRSSEQRCEIWTQPIVNMVDTFTDQTVASEGRLPTYDFHCYVALTALNNHGSSTTCEELNAAHNSLG